MRDTMCVVPSPYLPTHLVRHKPSLGNFGVSQKRPFLGDAFYLSIRQLRNFTFLLVYPERPIILVAHLNPLNHLPHSDNVAK